MKEFFIIPIFGTLSHILVKKETEFCVSVYKSVCVHAHVQAKRPTTWKFGTEILERVFKKTSRGFFFFNRSTFLERFLRIFSWIFNANYSFYFAFLRIFAMDSKSSAPKFSIKILKKGFWEDLKTIFSKIVPDYLQGFIKI